MFYACFIYELLNNFDFFSYSDPVLKDFLRNCRAKCSPSSILETSEKKKKHSQRKMMITGDLNYLLTFCTQKLYKMSFSQGLKSFVFLTKTKFNENV